MQIDDKASSSARTATANSVAVNATLYGSTATAADHSMTATVRTVIVGWNDECTMARSKIAVTARGLPTSYEKKACLGAQSAALLPARSRKFRDHSRREIGPQVPELDGLFLATRGIEPPF